MTRVEPCVCGGAIAAANLAACTPAVRAHNSTVAHRLWRMLRAPDWAIDPAWINPALLAERLPVGTYFNPRRRWPTAADQPVDLVREGDTGASVDGVEDHPPIPHHFGRLWTQLRGKLR